MKNTHEVGLSAVFAMLALALPACIQDGDLESPDEHLGPAAAPLEGPGADGPACARDGKGPGPGFRGAGKQGRMFEERFEQADANGDGQVTSQELEQSLAKRFAELDTDGNGAIEQAEMDALRDKHMAARLGELDTDGNGSVSREEAPPRLQAHFDEVDTNQDGSLSSDELRAARPQPGEMRGRKGNGKGRRGDGTGPAMGRGMGRPDGHPGFGRMDADGDGKVTAAEMAAAEQRWFKHLDADADGVIRKEELGQRGPR